MGRSGLHRSSRGHSQMNKKKKLRQRNQPDGDHAGEMPSSKISLLVSCVMRRDEWMVDFFLDFGHDPNQVDEDDGQPLLYWALLWEDYHIARRLLECGADPNLPPSPTSSYPRVPPLCLACRNGDLPMVVLLLQKGADVMERDFRGETCVFHALRSFSRDLVLYLMHIGAEMNVRNSYGYSLVDFAWDYWPEMVDFLLSFVEKSQAKPSQAVCSWEKWQR